MTASLDGFVETRLGGAAVAASFMKLDLIDEFRLFVGPVVLGGGKPYFAPLNMPLNLRLIETRTFPSSTRTTSRRADEVSGAEVTGRCPCADVHGRRPPVP